MRTSTYKFSLLGRSITKRTSSIVRAGLFASTFLLLGAPAYSQQNVGIGTTSPDSSAILDLTSSSKGFLTPRMSQAERNNIILPAKGLIIFNTTANRFEYNDGTAAVPNWVPFSSSGNTAWATTGNTGTNPNAPTNNFLGTADNQPLALRTNNTERLRILSNGKVAIGLSPASPASTAFGDVQVNMNGVADKVASMAVVSTGSVNSGSGIGLGFTSSKQTNSITNVAGYFIASNGTNNYSLVTANGNVFLGHVDSLTPPELRIGANGSASNLQGILTGNNINRTYVHHLNMSGELNLPIGGPGVAGQIMISQGNDAAPQWINAGDLLGSTTWNQDGNNLTTEQRLGTNTNIALPFITNDTERMRISADGRVGIGTNNPANSAAAEVFSNTKGFLMPRMTVAQRDAIASPAEGLVVYVTTASNEGFWYYDGTQWLPLTSTISANSTVVTRRKASTQNSFSSTLQDDSDLFLALGANQMWEVEGMIDFSSASADPDAKFGFTSAAGSTFKMTYHANDAVSTLTSGANDGSTESVVNLSASASGIVHIKGIVVMGATPGDFRLRWSQNATNAIPTSALTNSYLKFTRIQ